MPRIADCIVGRLADWGVRHIFMVTGGGAMHLNDAVGREPRIRYICTHGEQAAAMAAEGYARITGGIGVVNVTTGPGSINSLNGVFGAWTDSIPMLVISGQVKRETCMATAGTDRLRQLGDQEADIIGMVRGITKYAALLDDPSAVPYHLERAFHVAQSGRPGPVWLDVPVDVQGATIDAPAAPSYDPAEDDLTWNHAQIAGQCRDVLAKIRAARRPVIFAGSGVRLAKALPEFTDVVRKLRIPVVTAWTHDLIASDDELFCGRPGTIGERAGNFTVQNSDLVLVLGSRLNIRQVSYNWKSFAPKAFKIQVDVDCAELNKPIIKPDLPIHCDLKIFLSEMRSQLNGKETPLAGACDERHQRWLEWCRERVRRYPVVQPQQRQAGPPLNPYYFVETLNSMLRPDDIIACGNATACIVSFQVLRLKAGQRLFSNSGSASMGYDLPAAIGAAVAGGGKRVICMAGDGSLQLNIQELATLRHHNLPVKVIVLNNGGYLSIRSTQSNFFGNLVGESPASGVSFPDYGKAAAAYGIPALRVDRAGQFGDLAKALDADGPQLIEIMLDSAQGFEPRLKSRQLPDGRIVSPELQDMYPFLEPAELAENMNPPD